MLALDTENLEVHTVYHTEFAYDVELRGYFTCRSASYSFSSFLHYPQKNSNNFAVIFVLAEDKMVSLQPAGLKPFANNEKHHVRLPRKNKSEVKSFNLSLSSCAAHN